MYGFYVAGMAHPANSLADAFNLRTLVPSIGKGVDERLWLPSGKWNCYAYALHDRALGWVYPGRLRDLRTKPLVPGRKLYVQHIRQALISDGLQPVLRDGVDPATHHIVACLLKEGDDFHFLRRTNTGEWAHKSGSCPARIHDEASQVIHDPETAFFEGNDTFAGYYVVPPERVKFYPRFGI